MLSSHDNDISSRLLFRPMYVRRGLHFLIQLTLLSTRIRKWFAKTNPALAFLSRDCMHTCELSAVNMGCGHSGDVISSTIALRRHVVGIKTLRKVLYNYIVNRWSMFLGYFLWF